MTPLRIFASSVQAVQDPGGSALYAALVEHLERRELLRGGPFDAAPCTDASSTISIAGAVRIGRRVRDPNTARGAGRAARRVHRPRRCAAQHAGEGRVAASVAAGFASSVAARVGAARVAPARVGAGAARVGPARVTARAAEDESAWVVGRRAPCRRGNCPAPVGPEAGIRPTSRGGQPARGRSDDRVHGAGQAPQPTAEVPTDGDRQGHTGDFGADAGRRMSPSG